MRQHLRLRPTRPSRRGAWLVGGLLLGGCAVYLFDPIQGRGRRTRMYQQLDHMTHELSWFSNRKYRDVLNRLRGLPFRFMNWLHRLTKDLEQVDDVVLLERVRSVLGHRVSLPRTVQVEVSNGMVTLTGQVLRRDMQGLLRTMAGVSGVRAVRNRLLPYESLELH